MLIRFVCLANSYKEGGRCVAGITLDHKNNPVFLQSGLPKWIRPISDTEHGEIHEDIVSHICLLDIVEIDVLAYVGASYQSENATFQEDSICIIGTFAPERLYKLCEERPLLFGNRGKAVHIDHINRLHHSLTLVQATNFEVIEYTTEDDPDRKKSVYSSTIREYNMISRLQIRFSNTIIRAIPILSMTFMNCY